MMHVVPVLVGLAVLITSGCTAATPPVSQASDLPLAPVRRLAIVPSGDSRFLVLEQSAEPGRTFDEIVKWMPYRAAWLRPLAALVHEGINSLVAIDRKAAASADLEDISPRSAVAEELARRLRATGGFDEVLMLEREPLGEERHRADAIMRVTVARWGFVRVREGDPALVSAFADVHVQMVTRETGVILWELSQDVTHPDRLPFETYTRQRDLARVELLEVLERAGHRLASELLYARRVAR